MPNDNGHERDGVEVTLDGPSTALDNRSTPGLACGIPISITWEGAR
jgi:hypothetical protein